MDDTRALFERLMFGHYMELKSAGWSHPDEGSPTPDALFWRRDDQPEMYDVKQIEAAWNGFQMAWKHLKENP